MTDLVTISFPLVLARVLHLVLPSSSVLEDLDACLGVGAWVL